MQLLVSTISFLHSFRPHFSFTVSYLVIIVWSRYTILALIEFAILVGNCGCVCFLEELYAKAIICLCLQILDQYRASYDVREKEGAATSGSLPKSVLLVGHSMGGFVARAAIIHPRLRKSAVETVLTLSSPHQWVLSFQWNDVFLPLMKTALVFTNCFVCSNFNWVTYFYSDHLLWHCSLPWVITLQV